MPRFVVLRHELPAGGPRGSHYDLMLEFEGVLRTWACAQLPELNRPALAERLADHRLTYLDYEGPVSGNRGSVTRVATGEYQLLGEGERELRVRLMGEKLSGTLTIERSEGTGQDDRISLVAD